MRLGFIGTGTITAHMVRGLKTSALADWPVVLSPRNAATAAELAQLPGVSIAVDSQSVVDAADLLILAVRPQIAEAVLRPLRYRAGQKTLSLIAGLRAETCAGWTGQSGLVRAIPLPFVADHACVTPIFPDDPSIAQIFAALGQCLPCASLHEYDTYAAASALMGSYFGVLEAAQGWMQAEGVHPNAASAYLRGLFGNLGDVAQASPADLADLRAAHSTKGGLNELVFERFRDKGGLTALSQALTCALDRVQGRKPD